MKFRLCRCALGAFSRKPLEALTLRLIALIDHLP